MSNTSRFAKRTNWSLETNQLTESLKSLRAQQKTILNLTESNPTACEFSYPVEDIISSMGCRENMTYHPDSQGSQSAREAVCQYYAQKGLKVLPQQVFLTASTSEAYSYLFRLLVNPGEQVIFPRPSYPLFSFLGELNDAVMDTYPLVYEDQWKVDFNRMPPLDGNTKVFVVVNPNNPTGSFLTLEERAKINALCLNHSMALVCDEVFSDFAFNASVEQKSFVENSDVLTFVLGGLSKSLGLPQMKLSWIVINGPQDLVAQASNRLEVIADTYLSVSTPAQNALQGWFSLREVIQREVRLRLKSNLGYLEDQLQGCRQCQVLTVQGGWSAILKILNMDDEELWVLNLLKEELVLVHPGYFFDFDEQGYVVLSLLPPKPIFQEGVRRILSRIESIDG